MEGNTIPVGQNTTVIIKVSGDLFMEGQEPEEIRFQRSEDRIRFHQSNDTLYIETHASLDLAVPRHTNVVIEKVGGSAFVQDMANALQIQKVGGDLAMQHLTVVRIDKVGGSCLINGVSEALTVGKIGGDLTIREVFGPLEVANIGGNADLQIMGAESIETRCGGDLNVFITAGLGPHINLRAGGNIEMYLPSNSSGTFNLYSSGETIDLHLAHQQAAADQEIEARHYEFTLGEGGSRVEAQAGGDIRVSDDTVEPESIASELERREEAWKDARERRGSSSWSGGFGFDRTSAWAEMVSRRAQEASRRAEQRAQSAMRRTEEQIRQAAEREMHRSMGYIPGMAVPTPPTPPRPDPVTEQERMVVLQMLQENKITVEQAEKLLAALEGRFND